MRKDLITAGAAGNKDRSRYLHICRSPSSGTRLGRFKFRNCHNVL